jgi:hypothetical protein
MLEENQSFCWLLYYQRIVVVREWDGNMHEELQRHKLVFLASDTIGD